MASKRSGLFGPDYAASQPPRAQILSLLDARGLGILAPTLPVPQIGGSAPSNKAAKVLVEGPVSHRQEARTETHDGTRKATAPFRLWRRTHGFERHGVSRLIEDQHRRPLPRLCLGAAGMEG